MATFGEPDWATPGATTAATTTTTTENAGTTGGITAPPRIEYESDRDNARFFTVLLSILDFIASGMMIALGILVWVSFITNFGSDQKNTKQWSTVLLASYMIMFAILLGTYELMWWLPNGPINRIVRRNFGFMYGLRGKGYFLLFVGFLTLGLKKFKGDTIHLLDIATGIAWWGVGATHIVLTIVHPTICQKYKAPTAGFLGSGTPTSEPQHNNPV